MKPIDLIVFPSQSLEIMYEQSFSLFKMLEAEVSVSGGESGSKDFMVSAIKKYEPENISKVEDSEFVFSRYDIYFYGEILVKLLESSRYKNETFKSLFILLDKISDIKIRKAINYTLAHYNIKIVKDDSILDGYYFEDFGGNKVSKEKIKDILKY